jgi:hypothetical protein
MSCEFQKTLSFPVMQTVVTAMLISTGSMARAVLHE